MHEWGPAGRTAAALPARRHELGRPLPPARGGCASPRTTSFAPDLRGHGVSDWEPPWSLGTHVADIVDTLDALAPRARRRRRPQLRRPARARARRAASRAGRPDRAARSRPCGCRRTIALERAELAREDVGYASVEEAIAERLAAGTGTDERLVREELPQHLHLGDDGRWRGALRAVGGRRGLRRDGEGAAARPRRRADAARSRPRVARSCPTRCRTSCARR